MRYTLPLRKRGLLTVAATVENVASFSSGKRATGSAAQSARFCQVTGRTTSFPSAEWIT